MGALLATMITTTSYGTWLPGDLRGFVDDGVVLPSNPPLLDHARSLMSSDPVYFSAAEQDRLFESSCRACREFHYRLWCASVDSWHAHRLVAHAPDDVKVMVGRLKNRMRQALNRGHIWTEGYDKRFCYNDVQFESRWAYIARHAGFRPLPR